MLVSGVKIISTTRRKDCRDGESLIINNNLTVQVYVYRCVHAFVQPARLFIQFGTTTLSSLSVIFKKNNMNSNNKCDREKKDSTRRTCKVYASVVNRRRSPQPVNKISICKKRGGWIIVIYYYYTDCNIVKTSLVLTKRLGCVQRVTVWITIIRFGNLQCVAWRFIGKRRGDNRHLTLYDGTHSTYQRWPNSYWLWSIKNILCFLWILDFRMRNYFLIFFY